MSRLGAQSISGTGGQMGHWVGGVLVGRAVALRHADGHEKSWPGAGFAG